LAREFGRLTVLENLMLAPQLQLGERLRSIFMTPRQMREADNRVHARAVEVLEISHLAALRDEYAANLSGGQKKLLELAPRWGCAPACGGDGDRRRDAGLYAR
jgi:branched-chain amino acid transport system ATP-binding protein